MWTVEAWENPETGSCPFQTFFNKLDPYAQAVVDAAMERIVAPLGIDVCSTEWGKPLGKGLYEIRIRQSLHAIRTWGQTDPVPAVDPRENDTVLLRVFVTFHGAKVDILFQGYDKGADPSERRQAREIKQARKHLTVWKSHG
ncbi:hypothetical protein [Pengzhenrongella sp.]|jgi:hypothetical protein|uniref:hypothetical protein n=1 Tax=Pengzhenrongella sp. TaxID=2888820 RepID=UPI002F93A4EC